VRDAGVRQLHAIELEAEQPRQSGQLGDSRVGHFGVIQIQRLERRQLSHGFHSGVRHLGMTETEFLELGQSGQ